MEVSSLSIHLLLQSVMFLFFQCQFAVEEGRDEGRAMAEHSENPSLALFIHAIIVSTLF